jgi:hypothetical protein
MLLAVWTFQSARREIPGATGKTAPRISRERIEAGPPGPAPAPRATLPEADVNVASAKPADGIAVRTLVENALIDCRRALTLHERVLGETAYKTLVHYRGTALACARASLKEATDPSDRDAMERALYLLSLPPTHGTLRHFVW